MSHRTGITLRLTPADRTAPEALQAFTNERTATRACGMTPAANDGLAAGGALTYPVCPVCDETHVFGRFPHFRGVPEKSGRRKSPLRTLIDIKFPTSSWT